MSRAQQLYELQVVDLEIDARMDDLARIEDQLQIPEWLSEARERLESLKAASSDIERRLRGLEWTTDDLRAKIAELEDKLYGGRVRNPKELSGLQQEADLLKKKRGQVEDALLELMLELETAQEAMKTAASERDRLEEQWRLARQHLEEERQRLNGELATLTIRREAGLSRMPAADHHLYAALRQERGGRAVARVERNMCQGCRIAMSSVEIQRARTSEEPVRCPSCGRILFVT